MGTRSNHNLFTVKLGTVRPSPGIFPGVSTIASTRLVAPVYPERRAPKKLQQCNISKRQRQRQHGQRFCRTHL